MLLATLSPLKFCPDTSLSWDFLVLLASLVVACKSVAGVI